MSGFAIRNPYFITACTQDDPDVNEPNDSPDAGGTQIPLAPSGMVLSGMSQGYLATDGDVSFIAGAHSSDGLSPRTVAKC